MPDRTNTRVPQRDDGPSNQCSEKAASEKIAYEVIIGAQQPKKRYRDTNRIYGPEPRVADPIHRHDCANSHHVTGWESGEARTPVKWVKIVDAIADERRIILHPCVGPVSVMRCPTTTQTPIRRVQATTSGPRTFGRRAVTSKMARYPSSSV